MLKVAQWENGFIKKTSPYSKFEFLSLFVYLLKTLLLSFSVTGSQLSQFFAVRN